MASNELTRSLAIIIVNMNYALGCWSQGWWSRSKNEGTNFDSKIYTMEYEAYNRYERYLHGDLGADFIRSERVF